MKEGLIRATILIALLLPGLALAKSNCKSLEQKACLKATNCIWVKGYTTRKGIKVSPYCRGKGGKKTAKTKAQANSAKKTTKRADKGKTDQ